MLAIINETADPSRYYLSERLWFVQYDEYVFAVMARTSDDAISAVQSTASKKDLTGVPVLRR